MDKWERMIQMEKDWIADRPALALNNSNPERVSKLLRNEATELVEAVTCFEITKNPEHFRELGQEMADVLKYLLSLSFLYDVDLTDEHREKTAFNSCRFPASELTKDHDYDEKYPALKQVVERDSMKGDFYVESGVAQEIRIFG